MPSQFSTFKDSLDAIRCKTCRGLGTCDDADSGDIMFNTWTCRTCNGSGFDPTVMKTVQEKLLELEVMTNSSRKESLSTVFDFAGINETKASEAIVNWFLIPENKDAGRA